MKRRTIILATGFAVGMSLFAVFFFGRAREEQQYIVGSAENKQYLRLLQEEFERYGLRSSQGIAVLELFATRLVESGHPDAMHRLLMRSVHQDPDNPYNTVILFLLANYYATNAQPQLAAYYYKNIINNYRNVEYKNEPIHLHALMFLVDYSTDAHELATYYHMLIYRFPDYVDVFVNYRKLIEQYQQLAQWDLLFRSYQELIDFCETHINNCQDDANQREYIENAQAQLRLFRANRYWTTADLETIVDEIKQALTTQSATALLNWQAGVNFFARSWEQEEFDFNSQINFNLGIFLRRSQVNFADELDKNSNAQEAYLRTWGWSHRIPTWYFYFRKVDFPADPEVHSNWEWAGIFFGELL